MASEGLHEAEEALSPETRDLHRAITSLMEEWEAVDWYQQRVDAAADPELAEILAHNRDEEIEHAAMVLEWIRRRTPAVDRQLRAYLFTEGPITSIEEGDASAGGRGSLGAAEAAGSLGLGGLKD